MQIQSVLSMAPLRISFLGGGTDISTYFTKSKGCVVSAAINKYVYVHIKRHDPLFQERYRISYSEVEHTNSRDLIKNSIVKGCLELLKIDEPIQISISADLPANSGLGSSSSFAVALLNALHTLKNENATPVQLAEEASSVEIELLGSPIGKQDQYAAAFGGLNLFEFATDGRVSIEPINLSAIEVNALLDKSILIWTGRIRDANSILIDQAHQANSNQAHLLELTNLTRDFKSKLLDIDVDWNTLGPLIKKGWILKQSFSKKIATDEVTAITDKLDSLGCLGYKLLGAGGGGFILGVFGSKYEEIQTQLKDWHTFKPSLDSQGARIVSVNK
jgi:D-glycero-alpha-D-manno-heptose-7-phosphate kinase